MTVWISGEIDLDVMTAFSEARKLVERAFNKALKSGTYGTGISELALIAIIIAQPVPGEYEELRIYHKRRKVCEFRLKIDHSRFIRGTLKRRCALLCDMLLRSISLIDEWGARTINTGTLREKANSIAVANGWARKAK